MKILGIIRRDSAVCYHRITMPLALMPDVDCHITNHITEETFEAGYDAVFYSRVLNESAMDNLYAMREKYGFKLFVDVDDYWNLDHWHPLYNIYQKENFAERQISSIVNADAVFTTHERLWKEIKPLNQNCFTVYNAIPKIDQYLTEPEDSDRVRLFWQGSVTHQADLSLIQYAIENLLHSKVRDNVTMVLAGFHRQMDEWLEMADVYTAKGKLQHQLINGMKPEVYYKAYSRADVCLIPLVASRFNGFKSNLKVLEAANMGLPCIVSNVHPYKDLPVNYANGSTDWLDKMKWYIRNEHARKDDGERLRDFCNVFYDYRKINDTRKQIFEYETRKCTVS